MDGKRNRGAPPGNRNAVGNKGGGAPLGNKNAFKHGVYERFPPLYLIENENRKKAVERQEQKYFIIRAYLYSQGYPWDTVYTSSVEIQMSLDEMLERIDWEAVNKKLAEE